MEGMMGIKKIERRLGFAELALTSSMDKNRSLQTLKELDKAIKWERIEKTLMSHYPVGISTEGADAYPPLMLFKCLLLQKWFRIPSDPELESQINDRISFKSFLKLPFDMPSPDHSTFSRFRKRLSEDALTKVNSEVLNQFAEKGLSINEGIAIDARLVQSASRPVSGDQLKELREKRQTEEGKVDKNGRPLKFSRDVESDWVVQDDVPHFGLKEHASVDVDNGFILATTLTPASFHESRYLTYCTINSLHTQQPLKKVYADKGYYGEPNRDFLSLNHIEDGIMRKDTTTAKLTEYEKQRNRKISKKRYIIEQYFGLSHLHDGAKRARFTTIIKNIIDTMCRQAAFNIKRGSKLLAFT
jgi:IS5 family transposase